jgi:hypothetical protein
VKEVSAMDSGDMSKRTHWVVRLVALAIIAAAASLPRGAGAGKLPATASALHSGEPQTIQASVAAR